VGQRCRPVSLLNDVLSLSRVPNTKGASSVLVSPKRFELPIHLPRHEGTANHFTGHLRAVAWSGGLLTSLLPMRSATATHR
jgi:hypothetical protein